MLNTLKKICLSLMLLGSFCSGMYDDWAPGSPYLTLTSTPVNKPHVSSGGGTQNYGQQARYRYAGVQAQFQFLKARCANFTQYVQDQILNKWLKTFKETTKIVTLEGALAYKAMLAQDKVSLRNQLCQVSSKACQQGSWEYYQNLDHANFLETRIADCDQKISYCNQLVTAHERTIVAENQAHMQATPINQVVQGVSEWEARVKQFTGQLNTLVSKIRNFNSEYASKLRKIDALEFTGAWVNQGDIKKVEAECEKLLAARDLVQKDMNALQKDLHEAKVRLNDTKNYVAQCIKRERAELKQAQLFLGQLRGSGLLSLAELKTLDAVNLTYFENGAHKYKAYNALTLEAKQVLSRQGISPEKFESMVGANALQKYLFEDLGVKINQLAYLADIHVNDVAML